MFSAIAALNYVNVLCYWFASDPNYSSGEIEE